MLRRDPFGTMLAAAILLGVIVTASTCYWYLQSARQLSRLQIEAALMNRERATAQQAAAEALEYGRRNPSIIPVLQQSGMIQRAATNPAPAAR